MLTLHWRPVGNLLGARLGEEVGWCLVSGARRRFDDGTIARIAGLAMSLPARAAPQLPISDRTRDVLCQRSCQIHRSSFVSREGPDSSPSRCE